MMTSLYPYDKNLPVIGLGKLNEEIQDNITLASILRDNGYYTSAIVSSKMIGEAIKEGFDSFENLGDQRVKEPRSNNLKLLGNKKAKYFMERYFKGSANRLSRPKNPIIDIIHNYKEFYEYPYEDLMDYSLDNNIENDLKPNRKNIYFLKKAPEVTEKAISFLKYAPKPFFLFLHYYDPHTPYGAPSDFNFKWNEKDREIYSDLRYNMRGLSGKSIREDIEDYDRSIRFVDYYIGRLLYFVDIFGLFDNTIIIITSDHGECFGEHDMKDFGYLRSSPCLFHTKTLYDEEIHVPLIIRYPELFPKGEVIDEIAELVDIMPTILDILSIPIEKKINGESLIKRDNKDNNYAFSQLSQQIKKFDVIRKEKIGNLTVSLRTKDYKFVELKHKRKSKLLFNYNKDPFEFFNYYTQKKEIADQLEKQLNEITKKNEEEKYVQEKLSPEDIQVLKSLDYLH